MRCQLARAAGPGSGFWARHSRDRRSLGVSLGDWGGPGDRRAEGRGQALRLRAAVFLAGVFFAAFFAVVRSAAAFFAAGFFAAPLSGAMSCTVASCPRFSL